MFVDTAEVGRALRNLVVNAIRHTPSDGTVEVAGDEDSGMATVSVSDSCGGIPAEHLPRVFDVAFRGETARTPGPARARGSGSSIARGIIEAHSGQIGVRNAARLPVRRSGSRWPPVPGAGAGLPPSRARRGAAATPPGPPPRRQLRRAVLAPGRDTRLIG